MGRLGSRFGQPLPATVCLSPAHRPPPLSVRGERGGRGSLWDELDSPLASRAARSISRTHRERGSDGCGRAAMAGQSQPKQGREAGSKVSRGGHGLAATVGPNGHAPARQYSQRPVAFEHLTEAVPTRLGNQEMPLAARVLEDDEITIARNGDAGVPRRDSDVTHPPGPRRLLQPLQMSLELRLPAPRQHREHPQTDDDRRAQDPKRELPTEASVQHRREAREHDARRDARRHADEEALAKRRHACRVAGRADA